MLSGPDAQPSRRTQSRPPHPESPAGMREARHVVRSHTGPARQAACASSLLSRPFSGDGPVFRRRSCAIEGGFAQTRSRSSRRASRLASARISQACVAVQSAAYPGGAYVMARHQRGCKRQRGSGPRRLAPRIRGARTQARPEEIAGHRRVRRVHRGLFQARMVGQLTLLLQLLLMRRPRRLGRNARPRRENPVSRRGSLATDVAGHVSLGGR
ncbi:hypothetical protein C8R47DRAFT_143822 [Mycena vitilis]|nr:hypothetical protein C8R47DRAFT_143822 [Mycena vitilis]